MLAKTGFGRTGAFVLPILQELLSNREGELAFSLTCSRQRGPDHAGADRVREDGHIHAAHSAEAAEQPPGRAVFLRLRALANERADDSDRGAV